MNRLFTSMTVVIFTTFGTICVYAESADEYWPNWRGPDDTGSTSTGNPPVTWSDSENIKWKLEMPGSGHSSPIVWGDKIFFQTAIKTDKKGIPAPEVQVEGREVVFEAPADMYKFDLVCVDRKSGKILWQKTAREEVPYEGHHPDNSFASSSPVTDGKHIWVCFGSHGLHCYDVDGNHKWSVDIGKLYTDDGIGGGSSPILAGDAVIVVMEHLGDSFIIAVDKITGKTIWKKDRDEGTGWATPLAVEVNGKLQIVTSSDNLIRSYDAKTGDLVWTHTGLSMNTIPTPVSGFGKVFCMSGFQGNMLYAIELGRTGDLSGTDALIWQQDKATPYIPSPLLYGDKLYFCSGNRPVISCYQAETGKTIYEKQKIEGLEEIYGSPVGVADRIYLADREGNIAVFKNSDKFEVLAVNSLDDKFDTTPAIAGKEIFLKGKKYLYCIADS